MKNLLSGFFMRSTRHWGSVVLVTLLLFVLFILVEIISFRHNFRMDLTPGRDFSLSEQGKEIIRSLKDDVKFTVFYRMGERTEPHELFEMLSALSPRINYRLLDLDRYPGQAELHGILSYNQTVVECRGKKTIISFPTEERVVNAILKLTQDRVKTVYFTKGHGEGSVKVQYKKIMEALHVENYEVKELSSVEEEEVPLENSILVVAGPRKDFLEHETAMLTQYVEEGGKIIYLAEPFVSLPNLHGFLEKFNITMDKDIIVDVENKLFSGDPLGILIPYYSRRAFTRKLKSPSFFIASCSFRIGEDVDIIGTPLARTSPRCWAKANPSELRKGLFDYYEGVDRPGPFTVAVLVAAGQGTGKGEKGEIVCFGDSDFISDRFIGTLSNKDLFLNTVNWLARREDMISIRPSTYEYPYNFMTSEQVKWLFVISLVIFPSIFLLTGIIIYVFRKRHG